MTLARPSKWINNWIVCKLHQKTVSSPDRRYAPNYINKIRIGKAWKKEIWTLSLFDLLHFFVLNLISSQRRGEGSRTSMACIDARVKWVKLKQFYAPFPLSLPCQIQMREVFIFNWKTALLTLHLPLGKSVFESWKSSRIGGFTWASMMMLFNVDLCCRTHADWVKFGAWFMASRKQSVDGWSLSLRTQCEGSLCKHSNCESSQHTPTSVIVQQIRANSALAKFSLKFDRWETAQYRVVIEILKVTKEAWLRRCTTTANSKDIWKSFGSDAARDYS